MMHKLNITRTHKASALGLNNKPCLYRAFCISHTREKSLYMKSFIAKRLNSILVNLRYLRFKLLKYKENNKKICNTFDHNFKNIPIYIMRKVSLERYFVLYDCALTAKISKMALKSFCDKTLHMICFNSLLAKFNFWYIHPLATFNLWHKHRCNAHWALSYCIALMDTMALSGA